MKKNTIGRGGPQGFRIQPTPEQNQKGKSLELYGTDLTKRASEGKLDPVIGREEEIRRTIQGMSCIYMNVSKIIFVFLFLV